MNDKVIETFDLTKVYKSKSGKDIVALLKPILKNIDIN
jgi:hypothetical protein